MHSQDSSSASLSHAQHEFSSPTQLLSYPTPAPSILGTPRELSPDVISDIKYDVAPESRTSLSSPGRNLDGWHDFDLDHSPSPCSDLDAGMFQCVSIYVDILTDVDRR